MIDFNFNVIFSQRLDFLLASHWELEFQYLYLGEISIPYIACVYWEVEVEEEERDSEWEGIGIPFSNLSLFQKTEKE